MKAIKYYVCKRSSSDNQIKFCEKYQFVKKVGDVFHLKINDKVEPLTRQFFKEHFKQTPTY